MLIGLAFDNLNSLSNTVFKSCPPFFASGFDVAANVRHKLKLTPAIALRMGAG